jgi:hypothetical protein
MNLAANSYSYHTVFEEPFIHSLRAHADPCHNKIFEVCLRAAALIPSIADLNAALTRSLIWKRGSLTGDESRFLRMVANLSSGKFARV